MRHKIWICKILVLVLLGSVVSCGLPQNPEPEIESDQAARAFRDAASKHRRELGSLLTTRGLTLTRELHSDISIPRVIEQLNASYPPRTTLVFYDHTGDTLRVWAISNDAFVWERVPISAAEIANAISHVRAAIGVEQFQAARTPHPRGLTTVVPAVPVQYNLTDVVLKLTHLLFPGDIAKMLANAEHIVIVPALSIGTVPFAILRPFRTDAILLERASMAIAPSLFDIDHEFARQPRFSGHALVIGNPAFDPDPQWNFPPLPGAEQEALTVAHLFGVKPLLGREATRAQVVREATRAEVIHLATHGVADSAAPLDNSFIALASGEGMTGRWTARDIQNARLNARLVVLSACQTGLGQVHDAGIIGLARAFQLAGAQQVVMSLWKVDDHATTALMQEFVQRLKAEDMPVPGALRGAMLAIRKKMPSPAKWAPFVVFGGPSGRP